MKYFFRANKGVIIAAVLIGIFEAAFSALTYKVNHVLNVPVDLSTVGRVEADVWIPIPDEYALSISVDNDGPEMLAYSYAVDHSMPGGFGKIRIPIKWSLNSPNKKTVITETADRPLGMGMGKALTIDLYRGLIRAGRYRFTAEIITDDLAVLQSHRPRLLLRSRPLTSATWQRATYNIVMLFQAALAPVLLVLTLLLVARGVRWRSE